MAEAKTEILFVSKQKAKKSKKPKKSEKGG